MCFHRVRHFEVDTGNVPFWPRWSNFQHNGTGKSKFKLSHNALLGELFDRQTAA